MAKMLIEDQTDLTVTIQDQMSQVNNWNALKDDGHTCDLMISYDGTLLTTFFHQDTPDVPEGMTIYEYVKEKALNDYDIHVLGKPGFENTYAIGVPQSLADEYGLETISDLIPIADQLVFGAEQEFFTLEGSMKYNPFVEFYGLNFAEDRLRGHGPQVLRHRERHLRRVRGLHHRRPEHQGRPEGPGGRQELLPRLLRHVYRPGRPAGEVPGGGAHSGAADRTGSPPSR